MQTSIASTSSCLPAGVTPLANGVLMWNQYDASGTPSYYSAAYVQTGTTLVRYHCGGASQGSMSVDSTLTLARSLSGTPSISCLTASGGSSCSGSGTDVPVSVSLQMSVADASGKGQPYTVTLTGQRRQT
jgi:hypothetical protein